MADLNEEDLRDYLGSAEIRLLPVEMRTRNFVVEVRCGHIIEQARAHSLADAVRLAQQKLETTLVQYNEAVRRLDER